MATSTTTTRKVRQEIDDLRSKKYPRAFWDPSYYADPRNAQGARSIGFLKLDGSQLTQSEFNRAQIAAQGSMIAPNQVKAMIELLTYSPNVSPGVATGLAEYARTAQFSDSIVDEILKLDAEAQADEPEVTAGRKGEQGSEAEKGSWLSRLGKSAARPLLALASTPLDLVQGAVRNTVGQFQDESLRPDGGLLGMIFDNPFNNEQPTPVDQSTGGQFLKGLLPGTPNADLGQGWFPGGESAARMEAAKREAAPLVFNEHWTLGRGIGSMFIDDPNSLQYRNLSGLIDVVGTVAMDPMVIAGIGSAVARGATSAAAMGSATRAGQRAAGEFVEAEASRILDDAAEAMAHAERLSAATTEAYTQSVRGSGMLYANSQKDLTFGAEDLAQIAGRRELLDQQMRAAQADLTAAQRKPAQANLRSADKPDAEAQAATQAEAGAAVDWLSMQLGDDGLDAMMSRVNQHSPELPGQFTDAVFMPGKRTDPVPTALPGSDSGADAIVMWQADRAPNLRSVDDAIENPDELVAAIRQAGGKSAVRSLTEFLTAGSATYGGLIKRMIGRNQGQALLTALKNTDIDGISDVFRVSGSEGGVWWTTRDVTAARWTEEAGEGAFRVYDGTAGGAKERIKSIRAEMRKIDADQKKVEARASDETALNNILADTYLSGVETRTSMDDMHAATTFLAEQALGVRRTLGGKPNISNEIVKQFLLAGKQDFDDLVGARDLIPGHLQAADAANRAMVALTTMGASEVVRVANKTLIQPWARRAREAVMDMMVKLDESPSNLGLLQRLTSGKIGPDILTALLKAKSEDEVLSILGPAVGIDIRSPLTPGVINSMPIRVTQWTGGRMTNHVFSRATQWATDWAERAGSTAPRFGAHINFADPQGAAIVWRNYLTNLPGMTPEQTDLLVGDFLMQTTEVGRASAIMRGMDDVGEFLIDFNATKAGLKESTKAIMAKAVKNNTRVFEGGRAKVNNFWLGRYINDGNIGFFTRDGEMVEYAGPQLEAELARGGVVLPNTEELSRAIGRWGALIQRHPNSEKLLNFVDKGMDYWRSAQLFRLAYTARNIGEMQFRMFLTGHTSIFTDPLGALAMASALNRRTTYSRGLFARFARYDKTADGKVLVNPDNVDLDELDNTINGVTELLSTNGSRQDERSLRSVASTYDVKLVAAHQPGFTKGWAEQLIMLRSSRMARLVAGVNPPAVEDLVRGGVAREDAVVDWLMHSPDAESIRREYSETGSELARMFTDPVLLRDFLFRNEFSIRARIEQYTAENPELVDFIANGTVMRGEEEKFSMSSFDADIESRQRKMSDRANELGLTLDSYVDDLPDGWTLQMRVPVAHRGLGTGVIDNIFDGFFAWNGRKEAAWSLGPEFSYAYNDTLVDMMPSLNLKDRQEIFDFIKEAESGRRFKPHTEILMRAKANMRQPDGPLVMDDAEKVAAKEASDKVQKLFYDAKDRKQLFHQLRLVMPFAQPFFDTLYSWGKLMAARPYVMEKFGRVGSALQEQGSGVIYDDFDWIDPFTDRESHDPTQGFIYTDPQSGESKFTFPLIGSALGAVFSPFAGFNVAESMQLTAPVQNLNLAFQGDIEYLPSVGPLVSIPLSLLLPDDKFGPIPDWFRSWVFPFGKPRLESGVVESTLLPSWARRLTGVITNENFRSYSYKGVMAYLATTKEYPGLQSDPRVQKQFQDDTQSAARILTFIRAVGAAVLPAAPTQEIYAADQDGRLIGTTYLADHWYQLLEETGNDYEATTKAFVDSYGLNALSAIVPNSEGDTAISGPGWEFFKKHGSEAQAYSDVIGYFFPGDFSQEAYTFQQGSRDRENLSVEERSDKMVQFLYDAQKTALEGRAAKENWDINQIEEAQEVLKKQFGDVIPQFSGVNSQARLTEVRRALEQFDDLADTRAGQGTQLLFEAYDEYTAISQDRYGSGLGSQRADTLREAFLDELDQITAEYGGFNEAEGSVTNISRLFLNVVTPRGE